MEDGKETPPPAESVQKSEVDPAVIAKIAREAALKEVEAVQKQSAETTQKALEEQKRRVLSAFGVQDTESQRDELAARLLTSPETVLGDLASLTKQQALDEIRKEIAEKDAAAAAERAAWVEQSKAVGELYEKRPDIRDSEHLREVMTAYYDKTDASLPAKERIALATKKLDSFLEKMDGKTAEQRVAALASIAPNSSAQTAPKPKTQAEATREYIEARKEREMKVRRGIPPSRIQFS